jgi:glucose-6-phosphate 1-epimerase
LLSSSCSILTRENVQILEVNNAFATAQIALFGGHMLSFKPKYDLRERLWVSKLAKFDGIQAIRGGVPVCWPWFGDHIIKQQDPNNKDFPSHGYVRTQVWKIEHTLENEKRTEIILSPTTSHGIGFDGEAQLQLIINIGEQCSMQLVTSNIGTNSFTYRCALHSYFNINNIKRIHLNGLSGTYLDKTHDMQSFETPSPYLFSAETDRVHLCQPQNVNIEYDNIVTNIYSQGHDSLVVWNPWQEKSITMQDMEDDSYLTMVCVETAVTQGQVVMPNKRHVLTQVIS